MADLTAREAQMLGMYAGGKSVDEIGARLQMRPESVAATVMHHATMNRQRAGYLAREYRDAHPETAPAHQVSGAAGLVADIRKLLGIKPGQDTVAAVGQLNADLIIARKRERDLGEALAKARQELAEARAVRSEVPPPPPPRPSAEILMAYEAWSCRSCGARYWNPEPDHGCGVPVPVTVTIARREA